MKTHDTAGGRALVQRLRTVLLRLPQAPEAARLQAEHMAAMRLALEMNADPFGKRDTLVLTGGGGAVLRIPVQEMPVTLGRGAEADYALDGASVSRVHARLERTGPYVRLVDVGSANGTRINGERVSDLHLRLGDALALGEVQLTVGRE